MPTPMTITYSLSLDAPGGTINADKLVAAINASSISVALGPIVVDVPNDIFSVSFKDTLQDPDRTILDGNNGSGGTNGQPSNVHPALGLIQSTDNTPNPPVVQQVTVQNTPVVQITPRIGGMSTRVDGTAIQATAGQTVKSDLAVPEITMHIEGVDLQWQGCLPGDHGILVIVNPAGTVALAVGANQGDMTVTLPPQVAPYYAPANGGDSIEFWSADWSTLIEVVLIASLSGQTLTLKKALNNAHAVGENIRVRVGRFVPVRGPNGIDGGFRLLGSGGQLLQHQTDVTDALAVGLLLSAVLITTSDVGSRAMVVNFVLRS